MSLFDRVQHGDAPSPRPPHKLVWHYTDARAALSICATKRLWASHATALNDSGELDYGWRVMRRAFDLMAADLREASDDGGEGVDFLGNLIHGHPPVDHFVLSACESKDVLNQWQHYGKSGYAVGLPADGLLAIAGESWRTSTTRGSMPLVQTWRSVLYGEGEQLLHAGHKLQECVAEIEQSLVGASIKSELQDDLAVNGLREWALEALGAQVGLYKHRSFAVEQECRMIFQSTYNDDLPAPKMRERNGEFLGYQEVGGASLWRAPLALGLSPRDKAGDVVLDPLPIKALRCGPTRPALRESRMANMRRMLDAHGYGESKTEARPMVRVSSSRLTYLP